MDQKSCQETEGMEKHDYSPHLIFLSKKMSHLSEEKEPLSRGAS